MAGPPRVEAKELKLDDAKWSALFTKAPPRFASLSTQAEATVKLPHNSSTEDLTKFFRDHGEGEYLDRLGIPPESEANQATRATHEGRHAETENDHMVAAKSERGRVARATKLSSEPCDVASEISLYTLFSYMQANRRPHDWQGTPMPWDVFELGLHCWRAAWPHLAPTKGTPGGIWAWPGRRVEAPRAGAGQKAHVHQRNTKHTLQTKVMRPLKKSM